MATGKLSGQFIPEFFSSRRATSTADQPISSTESPAEDGLFPKIVYDADLPGGHRHFLDPKTQLQKQRLWRTVIEKESERLRKALLVLVSKTNHKKETKEEAAAADDGERAGPTELYEKYGRRLKVVGSGAYGTVRVYRKPASDGQDEVLFAIKEFHQKAGQTYLRYSNRVLAEFKIARGLQHANVVRTLDLLHEEQGPFFEVMQYCAAGTLASLLDAAGPLDGSEADCFFKQLAHGVEYLHGVGIAHCDLKPDNLLLTTEGSLKISDFGCSQWILPLEGSDDEVQMLSLVRGSKPYIAPEEYTQDEFDGRAVDVWACGVIYMHMRLFRHLWYQARQDDMFYTRYVEERRVEEGYAPIESLEPEQCRNVVYSILDPLPMRRLTVAQFLRSEWGRSISICKAGRGP
ncbi:kinase domain-containing protein [Apiospora kogelbergensis]|uniref:non-specific serine/threonine protein kinase n=1 Tax=Apiospora kogelbergensis TaxID=1337665 RepID=A0AAW0RB35_9PEZI